MDTVPSLNQTKNTFKIVLVGIALSSGIRQLLRNRILESANGSMLDQLDLVNVAITIALSCSFYPLLYYAYRFAYRGTEEKDTTIVLVSVVYVSQFAIVRDVLFSLYALLEYRMGLFQSSKELDDRVIVVVFFTLDAILWILTIVYFIPLIIDRLQDNSDELQQSFSIPFLLSTVIFWITWIFNYLIIRMFVELPLGREMFE
ncbi:MAG: hypothetical protein ACW99F_02680 [Candidatus Hodarchaeales archaeon]